MPTASSSTGRCASAFVAACSAWFEAQRDQALGALVALENAPLKGAARGLAYQLSEALGALPRNAIREQLAALSKADRRALAALGLQIGRVSVWIRPVQNGRAARLAQMLLALHRGRAAPPAPSRRPVSFVPHPEDDAAAMHAAGYRLAGPLAVRIDALERLAAGAAKLAEQGPFAATDALAATVGVETAALATVLQALGYRRHGSGPDTTFERRGRRQHPQRAAAATTTVATAPDAAAVAPANPDAASPADAPVQQTDAKPKRRRRRRRGRKPHIVETAASSETTTTAATQPQTAAPTDARATDDAKRSSRRKHSDRRPERRPEPPRRKPVAPSPDSPFAILATIDWTRRS